MSNNVINIERLIYTPSDFAKEALFYLQELGQSTTIKENKNIRKSHDSFLLLIILDGEGQLTTNSNVFSLNKGDLAFIDCHSHYSHISSNWTIKWIHFNGSSLSKIYKKFKSRNGSHIIKQASLSKYSVEIDKIKEIVNSNSYVKDMEISNVLSNLLTLLIKETVYEINNQKQHTYNLNEIKEYIDNNFENDISLEHLSSIFYINKFYLTRTFKIHYGITINNYISLKRITKAKELLRYSSLSINDISKECGYSDQNYFSRSFKKYDGNTPNEYRKMW